MQAQRSQWPDEIKLRVYKVCQKQVSDALRPQLTQAADLAGNLPTSLDGLITARNALAPIEEYRQSLEQAFGTIDQENLLPPLWQRIAALESHQDVAVEFRAALEAVRQQPNPRVDTEYLILRVVGQQALSSPLTVIARKARLQVAFDEVEIEVAAHEQDRSEPSAKDVAAYMYQRIIALNDTYAAMRCAPGTYDFDPITIAKCQMGELEVRLKYVMKNSCRAEKPGTQYVCEFYQRSQLVSFRTGEPATDSISLQTQYPGGRLESSITARFVRNALDGSWTGSDL